MDLHEVSGVDHRRHPWEVARARFFQRVLADAGVLSVPRAVLDVGAGDGYLARGLLDKLPTGSEIACLDPNYTDADLRTFMAPPRAGLSFLREAPARRFDVIEHVADDRAFLSGFVAHCLAPGAFVLVSVPAWPWLFSAHDTALKHHRRYRPKECETLLAEEGLVPVRGGGLFHSLLVPRALTVARDALYRRLGRPPAPVGNLGAWRGGNFLSAVLERALAVDNAVSHSLGRGRIGLPGLSVWALCRARGGSSS